MLDVTPAGRALVALMTTRGSGTTRVLPPDVADDVARRLVIAAAAVATVAGLVLGVVPLVERAGVRPERPLSWLFATAALALSVGVAVVARRLRDEPRRLVRLGLVYEVLVSLCVSLWEKFGPYPQGEVRELSFVAVLVVLFPVLVPATPRQTLVAALAAAATGPVAHGLARLYGYDAQPLADEALALFFSTVCACLAVAPALVVTRLVGTVSEARALGAYRLESLLGRGGMGEVWRARHHLLARPAAVKVIPPASLARSGDQTARTLERFRREARVTARLRSQHTVRLYDFGTTDDGAFYYAMELLDGLDLESLVQRHGPLPPARVVHLLAQACLSLEEAHRHGLVHRDVKPANLFVCRQGLELDVVKVLDFGLVSEEPGPEALGLTGGEGAFGTPACMAPEQVRGREVGPQADVYGLGCVAWWLLAGGHVFGDRSATATILAHVTEAPGPLRARAPGLPEDLEALVHACLAKAPEERPAGALDLRARLLACASAGAWTEADAAAWWAAHGEAADDDAA